MRCILCGETEVTLYLDTDNCTEFVCSNCDGRFTLVDVETAAADLARLIRIAKAAKQASKE